MSNLKNDFARLISRIIAALTLWTIEMLMFDLYQVPKNLDTISIFVLSLVLFLSVAVGVE